MPNSTLASTNNGRAFSMLGLQIEIVVTSESTAGAYSIVDQRAVCGAQSPPHTLTQHKVFIVAEGEFAIWRGNEIIEARVNDAITVAPGVPHRFKCVSAEGGRLVVFTAPGGHDRFLRELAEVVAGGGTPDREAMRAVAQHHGVRFLAEPRMSSTRG